MVLESFRFLGHGRVWFVLLSVGITMLGLVVLWGISVHHRHVLVKQVAKERQRRARTRRRKKVASR